MESSEHTESKGCKQSKEDNYERTAQDIKECLPKQLAPNNVCESPLRSGSKSRRYTYDDGRDDETVAH
jgi:hypothetical protein